MEPMYALRDRGLNFGVAWRCYSHESLTLDMKHWSPTSKTPAAFCSRPGPALKQLAESCDHATDRGWAGAEQALTGHGARAPGTLRTLGRLHAGPDGSVVAPPAPWTGMSSAGTFQYSIEESKLVVRSVQKGTSFTGLPKSMVRLVPSEPGKPYECIGSGPTSRAFFEPVSSVVLPDGSYLAANIVCFADSPPVTYNHNITAKSLVACE